MKRYIIRCLIGLVYAIVVMVLFILVCKIMGFDYDSKYNNFLLGSWTAIAFRLGFDLSK